MDPWFPRDFELSGGRKAVGLLHAGEDWQIYDLVGGGRGLVAQGELAARWVGLCILEGGRLGEFESRGDKYQFLDGGKQHTLAPVSEGIPAWNKADALSFALALKATRQTVPEVPLHDSIFVERLSVLLPTFTISSRVDDEVVLGFYLTGGFPVPATSFRRLHQRASWLPQHDLKEVVEAAGFPVTGVVIPNKRPAVSVATGDDIVGSVTELPAPESTQADQPFHLAGRPELTAFFNEHIVDVVRHPDRYQAFGIGFPGAVILHGPPGCGKTFAAEKLVEYLGWPSFQIDSSSIGSKYIHETSQKIAEVFDRAADQAPSVVIVDEMEAFLAERSETTHEARIEEVGEFLRRIPEATKNKVLVIAMTNNLKLIDSAIRRRGRFDHILEIGYATAEEVESLIQKLLEGLPVEHGIEVERLASSLVGRPLSDVAFVVREGARLAARAGLHTLNQECLDRALDSTGSRTDEVEEKRRIGFV